MNAISRSPRPVLVDTKNIRVAKKPRVTEADKRDSRALDRAINAANAGIEGHERISNSDLGAFAATLGGSRHEQVWGEYRRGRRHIPARDKLIAALYLKTKPERLFTSWKFSLISVLIQVLSHENSEERELLSELISQFVAVDKSQREAVLAQLRAME